MAYQYRGVLTEPHRPTIQNPADTSPTKPRAKFNPDKCGTRAGYRQHQNYSVKPCDPCKAAQAKYMSDRRAKELAAAE